MIYWRHLQIWDISFHIFIRWIPQGFRPMGPMTTAPRRSLSSCWSDGYSAELCCDTQRLGERGFGCQKNTWRTWDTQFLNIPKIAINERNGWYKPCFFCWVSDIGVFRRFRRVSLANKPTSAVIETHQVRQWTIGLRQPRWRMMNMGCLNLFRIVMNSPFSRRIWINLQNHPLAIFDEAGSSKWPFQASIQGHEKTQIRGHFTISSGTCDFPPQSWGELA